MHTFRENNGRWEAGFYWGNQWMRLFTLDSAWEATRVVNYLNGGTGNEMPTYLQQVIVEAGTRTD